MGPGLAPGKSVENVAPDQFRSDKLGSKLGKRIEPFRERNVAFKVVFVKSFLNQSRIV